jgi:hypothetical protein
VSNFMQDSEFGRAISDVAALVQQITTEFETVDPQISEFDRAMSDTHTLVNGINTLSTELANEPGQPHDELRAELDRITHEASQGAAEVVQLHRSEPPDGDWGISSSNQNMMDLLSGIQQDVAKIVDPSTSDEERDRISRRTARQSQVMGGMNAVDSIRNSVGQSSQDLIWQNAQHQSQVNLDAAEIQRNSHTDAMQQAVTQGDADAAAKAAEAAAQSHSQMDYYRNMTDIYEGNT